MKLKDMSKEELEALSYAEIAALILEEKKSKMKIVDIFKKICELLELSDSVFENRVADFFEIISTDKNFLVLDKGFCDLRKKHNPKVIVEDDDEEIIDTDIVEEENDQEEEKTEEETEEDIFYDNSSDDDDVEDDDDLGDFMVVEDEEASL